MILSITKDFRSISKHRIKKSLYKTTYQFLRINSLYLFQHDPASTVRRKKSTSTSKKVQVGKDQEKAQSEKDSHSKNRGGKKTKLTIRYLYHETYHKPNGQLFSQ